MKYGGFALNKPSRSVPKHFDKLKLLPSGSSVGSCSNIISQRRRLSKTIRCNSCVLSSILLLHPSSCYVASDPRSYILVGLNHDEENDAVDDNHAENHTQVNPFWSVQVDLEDVLKNVFTWNLESTPLAVKHQASQIILVLTLKEQTKQINLIITWWWLIWSVVGFKVITCSAQKWKLMYDIG